MAMARGPGGRDRRAERPRQAGQQAADRARELGQRYELGELITSATKTSEPRWRTSGCLLMGVAIVASPTFLAAIIAPGLIIGERVLLAAASPALLAAGLIMARTAPPTRTSRVLAYAGGLLADRAADPPVIPWVLLDHVAYEYQTDDDGGLSRLNGIRAVGLDGTVIGIAGPVGVSGLDRLGRHIDAMVVAMRLPAALEQCAGGQAVAFGPLSAGMDGIGWTERDGEARWAAWPDIDSVQLERHRLRLETRGRRPDISLTGVPDALVATLLIQDLAARQGVPQRGRPVPRP